MTSIVSTETFMLPIAAARAQCRLWLDFLRRWQTTLVDQTIAQCGMDPSTRQSGAQKGGALVLMKGRALTPRDDWEERQERLRLA
jgi:hypothetical protein